MSNSGRGESDAIGAGCGRGPAGPGLDGLPPGLLSEAARRVTSGGVDLVSVVGGDGAGDASARNLAALRRLLGLPQGEVGAGATAAGTCQCPYRIDVDAVVVLDQRRFPGTVVEVACRNAAEIAAAIHDGLAQGAGTVAAVGAYGLVQATRRRPPEAPLDAQVEALEADAAVIAEAAPPVVPLRHSIERLVGRGRSWARSAPRSGSRPALADVLQLEADTLAAEELVRLVRLVSIGVDLLRAQAAGLGPDRRLRVLVHGPIGSLAYGPLGTAVTALSAAIGVGLQVHVWVAEGRPPLTGVRTAWELGQSGVGHGLVPDSAVGGLLAAHDVDLVLLGALGVRPDGAVVEEPGAHGVAAMAARVSVPVYVFAPGSSLSATPDMGSVAGYDVTPAEVVNGFVTESGIVRPPFEPALAVAAAVRPLDQIGVA